MSAEIICFRTGDVITEKEGACEDKSPETEEELIKQDKECAHFRFDVVKDMIDQFIDDGYDFQSGVMVVPHCSEERLSCLFVQLDGKGCLYDSAELLIDGYFKVRSIIDEMEDEEDEDE